MPIDRGQDSSKELLEDVHGNLADHSTGLLRFMAIVDYSVAAAMIVAAILALLAAGVAMRHPCSLGRRSAALVRLSWLVMTITPFVLFMVVPFSSGVDFKAMNQDLYE